MEYELKNLRGSKIKLSPRRQSDRSGYLCMPLRQNVPRPTDKTWKPATCPECGCECWDRPLPEGFTVEMFSGKLCTICALKKGLQG